MASTSKKRKLPSIDTKTTMHKRIAPDSLTIKKFKKITEEITLTELGHINYLVGKNGHGKSSVLEALLHLQPSTNALKYLIDGSLIELRLEGKTVTVKLFSKQPSGLSRSLEGALSIAVLSTGNQGSANFDDDSNEYVSLDNYHSLNKDRFNHLNESLALTDHSKLSVKRMYPNDAWSDSVGQLVFQEGETSLEPQDISQGVISLNNIRTLLGAIESVINDSDKSVNKKIVVLIEEPENNLHPGMQKKLPKIFQDFLDQLQPNYQDNVWLFVSTHSPFVVSAAAPFPTQKIYLLSDGSLLDLEQKKVPSSEGYSGHECAWIVGQMLGSEIVDLGYPENYCILEEYSLQVILEDCKKKGIIRNYQFVSASGASRQVSLEATINEISNLNTLIKCNPYYFDKYFMIMDNTNEFNGKELEKIKNLRKRLNTRFVELSKPKLENYYEKFNKEIYMEAIDQISKATGRDKGIAKEKAAILISQNIQTKADFSKLFQRELDFLLP
jgi:energy-coupling factor transporter ATP-binding protein EcfA2